MKTLFDHLPSDFHPKCGLILGSGLSDLLDIDVIGSACFSEIAGFYAGEVVGQRKRCVWGYCNDVPVVIYQGRAHLYEGAQHSHIKHMVRAFKDVGCTHLLLTNAAGSLNQDVGPGEVVMIKDHLNLQGISPLMGPNDDQYGPRFVGLENAYDANWRAHCLKVASAKNIHCTEGVYAGVWGPHYETHAEIRALKVLGADLVGMSTIAEVIVARHCGLKVIGLSAVSNFASGISEQPVDHSLVVEYASLTAEKLRIIVPEILEG